MVFEDVWKVEHAKLLYSQLKKLADEIIARELYTEHLNSMFTESIGGALSPEEKENWCGGDGSMLAIGTDGACYPCLRYMSYSFAEIQ